MEGREGWRRAGTGLQSPLLVTRHAGRNGGHAGAGSWREGRHGAYCREGRHGAYCREGRHGA